MDVLVDQGRRSIVRMRNDTNKVQPTDLDGTQRSASNIIRNNHVAVDGGDVCDSADIRLAKLFCLLVLATQQQQQQQVGAHTRLCRRS